MEIYLTFLLICATALILWRLFYVEVKLLQIEEAVKLLKSSLEVIYFKKEVFPEKKVGANRKPRTDEQKIAASLKRKEWWEKKKASEASAPEALLNIRKEI